MFNKFAQWCDDMRGVSPVELIREEEMCNDKGRTTAQIQIAKTGRRACARWGVLMLLSPLAAADVGLPKYQQALPDAHQPPATVEAQARPQVTLRQISHDNGLRSDTPLHCDPGQQLSKVVLDFAPPADKRVDNWPHTAADADEGGLSEAEAPLGEGGDGGIPLYIGADRAALRTGEVVNTIRPVRSGNKLILVSKDSDYFNRLQSIRPKDRLLVQTQQTLRHYQVTGAGVTQAGLQADDLPENTLTLAACYPFQPIGSSPLLYEVQAQPIPAPLASASMDAETGNGSQTTVSF